MYLPLQLLIPVGVFFFIAWLSQDKGPGLSKDFPLLFRVLAFVRTPMLMFIVIPLSFAMNTYCTLRERWRSAFEDDTDVDGAGHQQRCAVIVDAIREWNRQGRPKLLRTARPSWAAMSTKLSSNKENCALISTRHLNHILRVDQAKLLITCEPNVTMGQITHKLLPQKLALKCQIEMEGLSIGGVSLGFGLETSSHSHGFFQETILEYELCTSEGQIVKCSRAQNPDLFHALPWSHGSLGFCLSVTVELVRVQPYVKITYIPTYTAQELQSALQRYTEDAAHAKYNFVEATIYSKDKAVLQLGEFVATVPAGRFNGINYFWKPFYYKHVETFLQRGREDWEVVPTAHFYHRFTRSIFWELEDMIPFSNHPLYRVLWGWMGAPKISLLKLFQGPVVRRSSVYAHAVQESIMPLKDLQEGIEKFDDWFGVYPLLVFPMRVVDHGPRSGFLTPRKENLLKDKDWGMWVDLGAYGVPRAVKQGKPWDPKVNIREMEHWTREKGGWQATYTDLFCTKKEFRQMFNHDLYDSQREKYRCADAFPEVYDKVKPEKGIVDLTAELKAEAASKE